MGGDPVMGVQREEDWVQEVALRNTSVEDYIGGCGGAPLDLLGFVRQKVLTHRQRGVPSHSICSLLISRLGLIELNAKLQSKKLHFDVCLEAFQVIEGSVESDGDGIVIGYVAPVGN